MTVHTKSLIIGRHVTVGGGGGECNTATSVSVELPKPLKPYLNYKKKKKKKKKKKPLHQVKEMIKVFSASTFAPQRQLFLIDRFLALMQADNVQMPNT